VESKRELNGRDLASLSNHLDKLMLWILHSRGAMSKYEMIQNIFASKGFSPNPDNVDNLLQSFVKGGLVAKNTEGFVTRFSLTEAGEEAGSKAAVELNNGQRFLSD
jgi:DNA-binding PadR family transcriptional regulator